MLRLIKPFTKLRLPESRKVRFRWLPIRQLTTDQLQRVSKINNISNKLFGITAITNIASSCATIGMINSGCSFLLIPYMIGSTCGLCYFVEQSKEKIMIEEKLLKCSYSKSAFMGIASAPISLLCLLEPATLIILSSTLSAHLITSFLISKNIPNKKIIFANNNISREQELINNMILQSNKKASLISILMFSTFCVGLNSLGIFSILNNYSALFMPYNADMLTGIIIITSLNVHTLNNLIKNIKIYSDDCNIFIAEEYVFSALKNVVIVIIGTCVVHFYFVSYKK
jgi:hypothetical protein